MNPPRILLFRGNRGGLISKLIAWQTNGNYSHAAIELPCGKVIEAWHKGGVRVRAARLDTEGVEAYEVDGMTIEQWAKALEYAHKQVGKKYDFGGVARFLTRFRKPDSEATKSFFCSELVFASLRHAGVHLLERVELAQVSPTVLSFSPLLVRSER